MLRLGNDSPLHIRYFEIHVSCLLVAFVLFFGIKFNAEVKFHSFFFLVS